MSMQETPKSENQDGTSKTASETVPENVSAAEADQPPAPQVAGKPVETEVALPASINGLDLKLGRP